jgi:uncharacterized membrane protein YgdD (TMEM256/DUF423 family)
MKIFGTLGALFCCLAVLAGALGAHALKSHLGDMGGASNFDLATHYMFYHGIALILVALAGNRFSGISFHICGWLFIIGTILFQGNLYLISLTGFRALSILTPVGGILLIFGWLSFAIFALKAKRPN